MELTNYLSVLVRSRLFAGMTERETLRLLHCIGARLVHKPAGSFFLLQGDKNENIAIVVDGYAAGEQVSADGETAVISEFFAGDVFGDVLSGASVGSIVSVRAVIDCTAVLFSLDGLLAPCTDSRPQQAVLLRNFIHAISDKYFALQSHMYVIAHHSLRRKVARYLLLYGEKAAQGESFLVPHSRDDMARYLNCERSALSRELSRMAKERWIAVSRRAFTILDRKALEKAAG